MSHGSFSPGITTLVESHREWVANRRIALLSHPAAVDVRGQSSAQVLIEAGLQLTALMGPEHGFLGAALAGEKVASRKHPCWNLPVHSLYGSTRRPTPRMLKDVETVVFDLQDLSARPYTYVSTLRLLLEAAAEQGKSVIVADRPIPLPRIVDGPVMKPPFESFVAALPVPMSYGMTPGEAALWIRDALNLRVDVRVARMRNYRRERCRQPGWPPWIPPSPGIASWESAQCYPALVFLEAFPAIDHGRSAGLPFQLFGAPWLNGSNVCAELNAQRLPGVSFYPHACELRSAFHPSKTVVAVRLTVTNPDTFRPIAASVHILSTLQRLDGRQRLWHSRQARPEFFDKLYGTDQVRLALLDNAEPQTIVQAWEADLVEYGKSRRPALLYSTT